MSMKNVVEKALSSSKKAPSAENIRVVTRCRNLLPAEMERGDISSIVCDLPTRQIVIKHISGPPTPFAFDAVYNNFHSQEEIFTNEVMPIVDSVLEGFNATVFAYGQSGSGKTYTMTGNLSDKAKWGMMPQTVTYLFDQIEKQKSIKKEYTVRCSYVELYNGKVRDLLSSTQASLEIKQNLCKNFYVKGCESPEIADFADCMRVFTQGSDRRQTASTDLNDASSRSHSLFTLQIESVDTEQDPNTPQTINGKINIVDLAGSERLTKSGATGSTAVEGCNINLSLSALAAVIDNIVKNAVHIPYRSSPLTMILKDSLGGNSKTVMFANVGPSEKNIPETISTLRFALSAKLIKNKPIRNVDPKDARIFELMDKIEQLTKRLGGGNDEELESMRTMLDELTDEAAGLRKGIEMAELEADVIYRKKDAEIEHHISVIKTRDALIKKCQERIAVLESELACMLAVAKGLQSTIGSFLKKVCREEQLLEIRNVVHQKKLQLSVRMPDAPAGELVVGSADEAQQYLDGFVTSYQFWLTTVMTKIAAQELVKDAIADVTRKLNQTHETAMHAEKERFVQMQETMASEARKRVVIQENDTMRELRFEVEISESEVAKLKDRLTGEELAHEETKTKLAAVQEKLKHALAHPPPSDSFDNKRACSPGRGAGGASLRPHPPALHQGGHQPALEVEAAVHVSAAPMHQHPVVPAHTAVQRPPFLPAKPAGGGGGGLSIAAVAELQKKLVPPKKFSLSVDCITGMPLMTMITRVVVYMADVAGSGDNANIPITSDAIFIKAPTISCTQSLDSLSTAPQFYASNFVNSLSVGSQTRAVVIIEASSAKGWSTYGHCVLPIGESYFRGPGAFMSRVRPGDPRQPKGANSSGSRRLDAELASIAPLIQEGLGKMPTSSEEYIPLVVLHWRKDSAPIGSFSGSTSNESKPTPRYAPDPFFIPFTKAESMLLAERPAAMMNKTPASYSIDSEGEVSKVYDINRRQMDCGEEMISSLSPYVPQRGFFVNIEKIAGIWGGAAADEAKLMAQPPLLHKVMIRVNEKVMFTKLNDPKAFYATPSFLPDPLLLSGIPADEFVCIWFTVFTVAKRKDLLLDVKPVAWSVTKIFLDRNFMRHGRISIPLFEGSCPPSGFVEDLTSPTYRLQPLEACVSRNLQKEVIKFYSPRALIYFSQGNYERFAEISARFPSASSAAKSPAQSVQQQPYLYRCARKLLRKRDGPEFDVIEPASTVTDTLESVIAPGGQAPVVFEKFNAFVAEWLAAGGIAGWGGVPETGRRQSSVSRLLK